MNNVLLKKEKLTYLQLQPLLVYKKQYCESNIFQKKKKNNLQARKMMPKQGAKVASSGKILKFPS